MRHYLYSLGILLISFSSSSAQTKWQCSFGAGPTIYFGDLGNEQYVPLSGINEGVTFTIHRQLITHDSRYNGNVPFALLGQIEWLRIGYDETEPTAFNQKSGTDLRNFRRGLNFRNDVYGANVQLTYTFYPWRYRPLWTHQLALYFFVGPGIYHSNPRADLFRGEINPDNRYFYWSDGTLRDAAEESGSGNIIHRDGVYETELRDWYTEGESANIAPQRRPEYSLWQIGFPHGGGIKYGISKKITFEFEACFYDFPFTDYLDDASSRYATFDEIATDFPNDEQQQELAKYISDPSGWGSDGTERSIATSIRGNPKKFDWINYMNVQLTFAINQKHSKSYSGHSGRAKNISPFRHK